MKHIETSSEKVKGNTKPSPIRVKSCRRWIITLNNYTEEELIHMHAYFESKNCKYIIGREVGEKNGTPHLQVYVEFNSPMRFHTLLKNLPRSHIESARGNRRQNLIYCSKDNDYETNFDMTILDKVVPLTKKTYVEWRTALYNYMTDPKNHPWDNPPNSG